MNVYSQQTDVTTIQNGLDIFCDIGRVLTSSLDPKEIFQRVMKVVGEYFSPRNWSLLLMEKNTCRLRFEIAMGTDAYKLKEIYIEKGEGIVGWVCLNGKPLLVEDAQNDPRFTTRIDKILNFTTRSLVCVPLLNGSNSVVGAIELINKIIPPSAKSVSGTSSTELTPTDKTFTEVDMKILSSIGAFTGIALENAFLHQKARELALIDPLTKISNRHCFNEILYRETEHISRYGHTICVLMIDVDDLKFINDNYGHLTGDKVLCDVADVLRTSVRDSDILARFGGDEFVILMPFSDESAGLELAERIQKLIRQWNVKELIPELKIGVSIGVHAAGPKNLENVFLKADKELYRYKNLQKRPEKRINPRKADVPLSLA